MRLRLTVEYDGSDFQGWQVQSQGRSVQGELETAFEKLTGARGRVHGAGRTDAGVHARGQVAAIDYAGQLAPGRVRTGLNALLPEDVRVIQVAHADANFDPRRDAVAKVYLYRILARATPSPLRRRVTWHQPGRLRDAEMAEAAGCLVGYHDFRAFRGAPGGAPVGEETRRSLDRLSVRREADEVWIRAESRGFLRYMVRNLAGTLVAVGQGRLSVAAVSEVLASRDRSRAGPTAPARGLLLERVVYPDCLEKA